MAYFKLSRLTHRVIPLVSIALSSAQKPTNATTPACQLLALEVNS